MRTGSRSLFLNIGGLEEYQKALLKMQGPALERMKSRFLRTVGLRFLEYAEDLTPVITNRLRGSLSQDLQHPDTIFQIQVTDNFSFVRVGTAVPYAAHVNDGYTQKRGQFVPGEWVGNTFRYNPTLRGQGMVLTGKVIPGARMFDKALDYVQGDMPQIAEFEFRRLFAELNG